MKGVGTLGFHTIRRNEMLAHPKRYRMIVELSSSSSREYTLKIKTRT